MKSSNQPIEIPLSWNHTFAQIEVGYTVCTLSEVSYEDATDEQRQFMRDAVKNINSLREYIIPGLNVAADVNVNKLIADVIQWLAPEGIDTPMPDIKLDPKTNESCRFCGADDVRVKYGSSVKPLHWCPDCMTGCDYAGASIIDMHLFTSAVDQREVIMRKRLNNS